MRARWPAKGRVVMYVSNNLLEEGGMVGWGSVRKRSIPGRNRLSCGFCAFLTEKTFQNLLFPKGMKHDSNVHKSLSTFL